ncbi:hypothetical protein PFISCL1PPCAC_24766 [Pristionchus fissidentatus]|uniref:Secreted protein n=1 Tax=Pristionchus fissidentatus TaxID=1538716 RepID=A0AAV5WMV7_9BILA|nr:hypothetical protein PFISCL1PPCAC_24764 [Pristionchus fissidentatus]GMT33469.1 hypothetical protein PFISCL1PPCAC_24766 [Pristionchus fissidentatus]
MRSRCLVVAAAVNIASIAAAINAALFFCAKWLSSGKSTVILRRFSSSKASTTCPVSSDSLLSLWRVVVIKSFRACGRGSDSRVNTVCVGQVRNPANRIFPICIFKQLFLASPCNGLHPSNITRVHATINIEYNKGILISTT